VRIGGIHLEVGDAERISLDSDEVRYLTRIEMNIPNLARFQPTLEYRTTKDVLLPAECTDVWSDGSQTWYAYLYTFQMWRLEVRLRSPDDPEENCVRFYLDIVSPRDGGTATAELQVRVDMYHDQDDCPVTSNVKPYYC